MFLSLNTFSELKILRVTSIVNLKQDKWSREAFLGSWCQKMLPVLISCYQRSQWWVWSDWRITLHIFSVWDKYRLKCFQGCAHYNSLLIIYHIFSWEESRDLNCWQGQSSNLSSWHSLKRMVFIGYLSSAQASVSHPVFHLPCPASLLF